MAPIYDYKAFSTAGKQVKGIIEADSSKTARGKLKKQGLMVSEIIEKSASKNRSGASLPFFGGRVSVQETAMMTRQLASLIKANIPLVEALTALVEQTENERLKVVLEQVRRDVNEGSSLAKATSQHAKIFDTVFINMIEAGESSGTLGMVLIRLADLKEAQLRLRNKVVSGMTYPGLMMLVSSGLLVAIFTFVIPKITKIFESMNKPLPLSTKIMITISGLLINWWFLFAGGAFFGAFFFTRYIASAAGRPKWDRFKLRAPVFGPLVRMIAITRFASTMSTLLGSGVPILTSLTIAQKLVDNAPISNAIKTARENITEGQSIADPLRKSGEFPPMILHMISIGEKTGELPDMLRNVAETYEEQVNSKIEGMTALLEPAMIVIMGGAIAVIIVSVFMPLMEMSNINQR